MSLFQPKKVVPTTSPRENLTAYLKMWNDIDAYMAKDVSALPCDKSILKTAILEEFDGSNPQAKAGLITAYRRLSLFQRLTQNDRQTIMAFYSLIGMAVLNSGQFGPEERSKLNAIICRSDDYARLIYAMHSEDQRLQAELVEAGFMAEAEMAAEVQRLADIANAQAEAVGMSTKVTAADFRSVDPRRGASHANS